MKAIYHSGRKESVFYEQDIKTPFPLRALSCICLLYTSDAADE